MLTLLNFLDTLNVSDVVNCVLKQSNDKSLEES